MSASDGTEATIRQTQKDNDTALALLRPLHDDKEAWKTYWQKQGQPWRTEPEIGLERQTYLTERLGIKPDIKQGIYPFKGISLSRADVEWLLAMHENGRGPVIWDEEKDKPEHDRRTGLDLRGANLRQVNLSRLPLAHMRGGLTDDEWLRVTKEQRSMAAVQLQQAALQGAKLQRANLNKAQLQGAILLQAQLQEANLNKAQLQEADLSEVELQGATLREAQLQGADLREAHLEGVRLNNATLSDEKYGTVLLADIKWGQVNLSVIDWEHTKELGDEQVARQEKDSEGERKDKQTRLDEYKNAVRANRQLVVVLQDQGLNEVADHFTFRAQLLQRVVLRWQKQYGRWFFSGFLGALTGYGYRLWHIFVAYGLLICLFATVYYFNPVPNLHLTWYQQVGWALVVSLTAFHTRTTTIYTPDMLLGGVVALEGILGLVSEALFLAMLIQRFFGK